VSKKDVRIGFVSAIDYAAGTVTVAYPDMDDEVTRQLPLLSPMADEYFMPKVEDQILVLHLSNGAEYGVIMGRPWDEDHKPAESGEGLFRKDFDRDLGKAFLRYDAKTGELKIKAKKIILEAPTIANVGAVTASQTITAADDVTAGGISAMKHTHTGVHGETTPPH